MASNFERVSDRIAEIIEESSDVSITPETIKVVRPTSIRKGIMSEGRVFLLVYIKVELEFCFSFSVEKSSNERQTQILSHVSRYLHP